ncbi:MAG: endonuclease V [Myxococcota bacterium]
MLVATDVHYLSDTHARAAAVVFARWDDPMPAATYTQIATGFAPYVPGRFFERELPCLMPLLHWVLAAHDVDTVLVDGYVNLGPEHPGLGRHVLDALREDGRTPTMVGVAKTAFDGAPAEAVVRGSGSTPLWVTAAGGMTNAEAANAVRSMDGRHRLPTLLLLVDHLARGHVQPS